ncbi:MAG: hypothetical protein ACYS5V_11425 [Planctomycetota bacterium]|jgi:hypothetical protein
MGKDTETVCGGCPLRRRCADGVGPAAGGPAGARLVGMAAGYFLAPLVAAIVAAALTDGHALQALAGAGAFAAALAAAVAIGALARRRVSR